VDNGAFVYPCYRSLFVGAHAACVFFGLSAEQERHLFMPEAQNPEEFGGTHCGYSASRQQVAANIRAFIKKFKT